MRVGFVRRTVQEFQGTLEGVAVDSEAEMGRNDVQNDA